MFLSITNPLRRKILRIAIANHEARLLESGTSSPHVAEVLAEVRAINRVLDFVDTLPASLTAKPKDGE